MHNASQTITQNPLSRRVKALMLGRVIVITFLWVALVVLELTGDPTPTRLPLTYVILITYFLTILYALVLRQQPDLERFYRWQVGWTYSLRPPSSRARAASTLASSFCTSCRSLRPAPHFRSRSIFASLPPLVSCIACWCIWIRRYYSIRCLLLHAQGRGYPQWLCCAVCNTLRITAFLKVALFKLDDLAESLRQTGQVLESRGHV